MEQSKEKTGMSLFHAPNIESFKAKTYVLKRTCFLTLFNVCHCLLTHFKEFSHVPLNFPEELTYFILFPGKLLQWMQYFPSWGNLIFQDWIMARRTKTKYSNVFYKLQLSTIIQTVCCTHPENRLPDFLIWKYKQKKKRKWGNKIQHV